jgi:hypothetical protein
MGGFIGGCFGSYYSHHEYLQYLKSKSNPDHRTPIHVLGAFYYIIPEEEYVTRWNRN